MLEYRSSTRAKRWAFTSRESPCKGCGKLTKKYSLRYRIWVCENCDVETIVWGEEIEGE